MGFPACDSLSESLGNILALQVRRGWVVQGKHIDIVRIKTLQALVEALQYKSPVDWKRV